MEMEVLRLQKQIEDIENKMIEILLPECRRLFRKEAMNSQSKNETEQEIKAFLELRKKLSERIRALTGYEIAACGGSDGMSGFHFGFEQKSFLPFQMIGWSAFKGFFGDWSHSYPGIAFQIEKSCFGERSPVLFFEADSAFTNLHDGNPDNEQIFIQSIYGNSSGITDLKVVAKGGNSPCRLEFCLTEEPQFLTVDLQQGQVDTQLYGGYVIQIPICGEFDCTFGEVTESGDVILHHDSFCMK